MNKALNILFALIVMAALQGCSNDLENPEKRYVYLSEERFSELNPSDVTEINVVLVFDEQNPEKWEQRYPSVFPIKAPENIKKIIQIIAGADRRSAIPSWSEKIVFETSDAVYYTGIALGINSVSGDWWDSEELLTFLYSLGLDKTAARGRLKRPKWEEKPYCCD